MHFFPLQDEQQTYALVRRTAAAAGLLLVGLLALIALLVTRQVVSPVRLAARTAERLAAGLLEERMAVEGEDELALLALSFNSMAASLQDQIRRLEDLSLVQRRFVSDVSHELRTPLTTVRMAAEVLYEERDTFPPHVARSAELLQAELDRFEELLVDLLEISRYDAGAASLDTEPVDLVALADRVLSRAEPLARARGSVLVLRSDAPVVAEVDQVRLERVLRNLVVNAVEHGEGRPVEVHVRGTATVVAVLVRDQGVGLQPGDSELVFTRFWRGDPSRARTTGGTGLGLAIAREDVRLHGGELEAWGEPGRGAAFRVTLPARAGAALGPSPLPLAPPGGGPRVRRRGRAARRCGGSGGPARRLRAAAARRGPGAAGAARGPAAHPGGRRAAARPGRGRDGARRRRGLPARAEQPRGRPRRRPPVPHARPRPDLGGRRRRRGVRRPAPARGQPDRRPGDRPGGGAAGRGGRGRRHLPAGRARDLGGLPGALRRRRACAGSPPSSRACA